MLDFSLRMPPIPISDFHLSWKLNDYLKGSVLLPKGYQAGEETLKATLLGQ